MLLHAAARNIHTEMVKLLLNNKTNIDASDSEDGTMAVHVAALNGDTNIQKLLLLNKADMNASAHIGVTAVYTAAENGHTEVVKLLLDNKADVNASCTKDGTTPPHAATWRGHSKMVARQQR